MKWKHLFRSHSLRFGLLAVFLLATAGLHAQQSNAPAANPQRPKITGISHVGYFVSDLPAAISFWHDLLGYDEYFTLPKKDGSGTRISFIKINDHQHIELFNEPPTTPHNFMSHICFTVDNVQQMRVYLRSKGFDVKDSNAGFMVGNSQKSIDFYGGILGFQETWRGGANPKQLSWINMRVPDGTDYVEFMLYKDLPDTDKWGTKNHLSLSVPDIAKSMAILQTRPAFKLQTKAVIAVGVNGKRQVNLYDPDGTRVELMEPFTADGKPVPPSTAPPPPPAHD